MFIDKYDYKLGPRSEEFLFMMCLGLYETARYQFIEENYFEYMFLIKEDWQMLHENDIFTPRFMIV